MSEPIVVSLRVDCSPEHAFAVWTRRMDLWWPRGHSVSGDPGLTIEIEPWVGGRILERTSSGKEHVWGEVRAWEPPDRLAYLWHIYGTRPEATDVEVAFAPDRDATRVTVTHTGWERLAAIRPDLRNRNESAWSQILPHFAVACSAIEEGERTMTDEVKGKGTAEDPWVLRTPGRGSELLAHRDAGSDPPALVIHAAKTEVRYRLRCIEDLHAMLLAHGDWMPLGNADEGKPVKEGTVEAWARAEDNPVGGYYGLKKGLRGRFANYVPPVMEALGLAEVEHAARNNRMRAIG